MISPSSISSLDGLHFSYSAKLLKNSTFFSTYWIYVGTVFTKPAPPLWLHCILWSEFLRCSHCQKFAPEWEKLAEKAPRYPTASMESIEKIMIKTGVSYRMRLLQSLARHCMMKYVLLGSQHDQPEQWRALVAFHPVTINPAAEIKWFDYILTGMVEVKPFAPAEQSDVFHLIWHDLQYVFICLCFLVPLRLWIWRCMAKMEQPWSSLIVMGLKDKWGSLSLAAQCVKSTESIENLQLYILFRSFSM